MNRELKFIFVLYVVLSGFRFSAANNFVISGGDSSSPFYQFTDSNSQTTDFSAFKLVPGQTYKFIANGISTSHPFMIGESNGDTSSSLVSGDRLPGQSGKLHSLSLPVMRVIYFISAPLMSGCHRLFKFQIITTLS